MLKHSFGKSGQSEESIHCEKTKKPRVTAKGIDPTGIYLRFFFGVYVSIPERKSKEKAVDKRRRAENSENNENNIPNSGKSAGFESGK